MFIFALKICSMTIRQWIKEREIVGKTTFSIDDIRKAFSKTSDSVISSELSRLSRQGLIQLVYKGFYTVVPIQYQARGIVPPLYYIDQLMTYLKKPYYISLLSAAELNGAAHQRPQKFSVTSTIPSLNTSRNKIIVWSFRRKIYNDMLLQKNSETGSITYSSPELTAADIVQYEEQIGGLSQAATVLSELLDVTDFNRHFDSLYKMETIASLQRLGYIIEDVLEKKEQADTLFHLLRGKTKRLNYTALTSRHAVREDCHRNERWKIIINQEIETDDI